MLTTTYLTKADGAEFCACVTRDETGLFRLTCVLRKQDETSLMPRLEPVFLGAELLMTKRQCWDIAAIWAEMSDYEPWEIIWDDTTSG